MPAPSNADYLNAINADKNPGNGDAIPPGYSLLYSSTYDQTFAQNGLYGNAYVNEATGQIIVAFEGPVTVSSGSAGVDQTLANAAAQIDTRLANNDASVTSEMQSTAAGFMANVQQAAESSGFSYSSSNVFVTGNSEGGFIAEVVSQDTGFGGASFGAPGMPGYDGSGQPVGSNFTNYINASDPIGNRGSDSYIPPDGGDQYHYGNNVFLGTQAESDALAQNYQLATGQASGADGDAVQAGALANLLYDAGADHGYAQYANSLGVTLNTPQSAVSLDAMPDATMFLRDQEALSGTISWNSNGDPTLTLTYSDGSTANVSVDTLSSGQYLYLYDQMLQNGQQGVSGEINDDTNTGRQTVGAELADGMAADVRTVGSDGTTTGEVQFAVNADGSTTVELSGVYLANYTAGLEGEGSDQTGWSQVASSDGAFALANGQQVLVLNASGQEISAGGAEAGIVLDAAGGNSISIAGDGAATVIGSSDNIAMGAGSSTAVDGDGNTITLAEASGSSLDIEGSNDTVSSIGNEITFADSNASLTVDGSGNTFTFTGTGDALTVNESSLAAGESSVADNYSITDGAATLANSDINFTDGSSELQTFDPQSGISVEYQDYSGANETGTLVDQGYDFTSGGSQFEYFNPNSSVTLETDNYTGADAHRHADFGRLQLHQWRLGAGRLQSVERRRCRVFGLLRRQRDRHAGVPGRQLDQWRIADRVLQSQRERYAGDRQLHRRRRHRHADLGRCQLHQWRLRAGHLQSVEWRRRRVLGLLRRQRDRDTGVPGR